MTDKQKRQFLVANIQSAPKCLNTNDKAIWVTGWNDCLEALAVPPAPAQEPAIKKPQGNLSDQDAQNAPTVTTASSRATNTAWSCNTDTQRLSDERMWRTYWDAAWNADGKGGQTPEGSVPHIEAMIRGTRAIEAAILAKLDKS